MTNEEDRILSMSDSAAEAALTLDRADQGRFIDQRFTWEYVEREA